MSADAPEPAPEPRAGVPPQERPSSAPAPQPPADDDDWRRRVREGASRAIRAASLGRRDSRLDRGA